MRFVSLALILAAFAMADALKEKKFYDLNEGRSLFEQFEKDFEKQYKDDADREVHLNAFVANLAKINKMNEESTSATFGINKFADYTEDERKNMFGFRKKE